MSALKPLGFLYEKAAGLKNLLYDKQVFHSLKLPVPVISLGNLTVGGTGKTPLTHFCLQYFERKKIRAAVVSRNYRAQVRTAAKVDLERKEAVAYFGDEPVLLAEKNPQATFFVGPQKYLTAKFAYEQCKPEVILVDDGFQHRQLARDLDLVILDATESWARYQCLPEGRAREPWGSLERADAFLISKMNLAPARSTVALIENLKVFQKPIVTFNFEIGPWKELLSGRAWAGENTQQRVLLVSGIGRPQAFEKSLQVFSVQILEHLRYQDHHSYTASDVQAILQRWKSCGKPILVTTEKDAVKLRRLWPQDVLLWVAPLEVKTQSEEEVFYEILAQVLR
jgi:tetraacyldisaccharide 4'-kinase